MAKHTRAWNESIYQRYIYEGRGQGVGADYTPWIRIQDFPSNGMVSRVKGSTTGRIHHLMSNNELSFFYLLDWSDKVTDIREQFPLLDLKRIIEIAEKAQIRYPYDNKSGFPYVLTSDFFIETTHGPMAITVKASSELAKPRVREKLEIERRYWNNLDVRWRVVTEKEINRTKARNIEWLSQARDLDLFCIPEQLQDMCIDYFMERFSLLKSPVRNFLSEVEHCFDLAPGMGLNIYKYLIYWKQIDVDISEPIDLSDFAEQAIGLIA